MPAGFVKSAVVYNLNRVGELAREKGDLVIVEGFFTVFTLWQLGIENVVALMGSYLSEHQKQLLVKTLGATGKVILLFDDDEAGEGGAAQCVQELVEQLFVKVVRLPEGVGQPDQLTSQQVHQLLAGQYICKGLFTETLFSWVSRESSGAGRSPTRPWPWAWCNVLGTSE